MGDEWVKICMFFLSEWMHELDTGVRPAHRALSPGAMPNPVVCNDYGVCSVCIVTTSPKTNKKSDVLVVMAAAWVMFVTRS